MRLMIATILLMTGAPATAQSPFDGVWRIDPTEVERGGEPVTRLVRDGWFECRVCVSRYRVRADGRFHPIVGQDFDAVAAKVVDARTLELRFRKHGVLALVEMDRVSADGAALTISETDMTAPDGRPQESRAELTRIGAAPAGAHAVSGDWRPDADDGPATELTIRTSGEAVTMIQPGGRRFTAAPGGPAAPIVGDAAGRTMRLERAGPRALRLVTEIAEKRVAEGEMTVAADGRTLTYDARDLTLGRTSRFVARRR
jgi:hypothetical protein